MSEYPLEFWLALAVMAVIGLTPWIVEQWKSRNKKPRLCPRY